MQLPMMTLRLRAKAREEMHRRLQRLRLAQPCWKLRLLIAVQMLTVK